MRPSAEEVRAVLDYDPKIGIFRWKVRTPDTFEGGKVGPELKCKRWNAQYAGKLAGTKKSEGYIQIKCLGKFYYAHILAVVIMTGSWPKDEVDHRDPPKWDNRWVNLREATSSQNKQNVRLRSDNTSGYKGVSYHKIMGKWHASIWLSGKNLHLGYFDTPEEAHAKRTEEGKRLHGAFFRAA